MPTILDGMPAPDEKTYPCKICGRNFVKSSLEKHEPVCKKLTKLHRKPFDSGKQRATGSDITIQDIRKAQKEKEKVGGTFPRPKTNWRERHDNFIEAVSASKKVDYALKTGAPLPPPPKTAVPSDYVQCEYCGRNFNDKAAERHVPFCRDQQARRGPVKPATAAKPFSAHRPLQSQQQARTSAERGRSQERPVDTRRTETRRGSLDRAPPTTKGRPTANSAGAAHVAPRTADKRNTSSAPRSNSQSRLKTPFNSDYPPKSSNGYAPKTPQTSNGYARNAPKTAGERAPKTPAYPPKTGDSRRDTSTSRSRRDY